MAEPKLFHWADYLVFAAILLGSSIVGVVLGILGKRGKTSTTKDFVKGGGDMGALPVAMSTLAAFLSAPSVLGTPAEVYGFGTMWTMSILGYVIAVPIMAFVFLPIYHRIELTSAYEYLEKRFNKAVRLLGSTTFLLMMLLYMGVVVYAPASAFSTVTGMDLTFSILGTGLICMFYTTVGGMKAAIYVDTFQMIIILLGLLGLVVVGTIKVGSIEQVWRTSEEGQRIDFDNFNANPTERHSFWSLSFGLAFMVLAIMGANQAMIQRFLTIKEIKQVQLSMLYAMIAMFIYTILVVCLGLVMYAYYVECDPLTSGQVQSASQMLPLFLLDMFGDLPGLPGLFSAAVFSASLSTVSAGIMGTAAVLVVDFIRPAYFHFKGKPLKGNVTVWILRGLSLLTGLGVIGLAFIAPFLGTTLLEVALSVFGMVGGPILGIFILGIFFPFVNSAGALIGGILSLIITFWVALGSIIYGESPEILPLRTDGCLDFNASSYMEATVATATTIADNSTRDRTALDEIYNVSYLYYSLIGVIVAVSCGMVVSCFTGCNKGRELDPILLFNYQGVCRCLCNHSNAFGRCWIGPVADKHSKDSYKKNESYYSEEEDTSSAEGKLPTYSDVVMEEGGGAPCYDDVISGVPNKAFVHDNSPDVTHL